VPLRDFQAYDPGRYVWGAFWFQLFGSSILVLRASNALFQVFGLTCGLLVVRRLTRSPWLLVASGSLLILWMYPRHKLFESSIALISVYVAVLLIENPSPKRHFLTGIFIGIAAFLGRQHGFYTVVSFFLLIGFIWLKLDRRRFTQKWLVWALGIAIGYSPMLWMLATVSGFWNAFIESLLFLVRLGNTNLPLPIPTVWSIPIRQLDSIIVIHQISIAVGFMLLPIFNGGSVIYLLWQKPKHLYAQRVLVGAAFMSLTYTHYAFSRADLSHLAQGIDPMVLGILAIAVYVTQARRAILGRLIVAGLTLITLFGVGLASPLANKLLAQPDTYVALDVGSDRLIVHQQTADFVTTVEQFYEQNVLPGEHILLGPHIPTLYPVIQQRSPLWDIYLLFPETRERQQNMIQELRDKEVNWIILGDISLDGRDELRFQNTHPEIWKDIVENFTLISPSSLPKNYQTFHRKA
jgi:hypothetical protein